LQRRRVREGVIESSRDRHRNEARAETDSFDLENLSKTKLQLFAGATGVFFVIRLSILLF
jgi:hypothetical protein